MFCSVLCCSVLFFLATEKNGSVHGDDDQKSDSETEGEKKIDVGDGENDAAENELLGLEVD